MAAEAKRACGYRKVGGLYMIGGRLSAPCCKLPIILHICPTCNQGIKQSRGWQWIDPRPLVALACNVGMGSSCALADPDVAFGHVIDGNYICRVGLLWIGAQFYPTPAAFQAEAASMGISRRIQAIPRGFRLGEDYVFFAHPKVKQVPVEGDEPGKSELRGGVFCFFRPTSIEKIVTQTQSEDAEAMVDLRERGITPVIVPDDDKDHQGSVYDDDGEPDQPQLAASL